MCYHNSTHTTAQGQCGHTLYRIAGNIGQAGIKFGRLASTSVNIKFGGQRSRHTLLRYCHDLIFVDFNLAVGLLIRRTAKLDSSPNISGYTIHEA